MEVCICSLNTSDRWSLLHWIPVSSTPSHRRRYMSSRGRQIITIVLLLLLLYLWPIKLCFLSLKWSLRCALHVALYAVRGLYKQANEHLAYKATLSAINLSWRLGIVFPCGTGTASWNSTTDAQKRPTSPGEWYPLALKPSYYFSQMFGAVYLPDWNGTGYNSTIRNNWNESCCVPPLTPTIWMLPMRPMRLPSLIKRHCQHHAIFLYLFIFIYIYRYIYIYIFVPPFLPITKLDFQ